MDLPLNTKIYEDDNSYSVIGVIKKDIIDDIEFDNNDDKLICDAIINSIEKFASENIKNNKAVALPSVGCIRRSIYRQAVIKDRDKIHSMRKHMNNTEYKEYMKDYFGNIKCNDIEQTKEKLRLKRINKVFKKRYDKYVRLINKSYADLFIFSVSYFNQVEFDSELNKHLINVINGTN